MKYLVTALFLLLVNVQTAWADSIDHSVWDQLLKQHVKSVSQNQSTAVDYSAFAEDHGRPKGYMTAISKVQKKTSDQWTSEAQLAFRINAYNDWTAELILTPWPHIKSIKDLGGVFTSPWSKAFVPLFGKTWSLDDIEHELIRGSSRYQDRRLHLAVNCASIGCLALRAEAYTVDQIDRQLDEQTQLFLADRSRSRLNKETLELSSIFKWYREDSEKGWLGYRALPDFLSAHADALGLSPAAAGD